MSFNVVMTCTESTGFIANSQSLYQHLQSGSIYTTRRPQGMGKLKNVPLERDQQQYLVLLPVDVGLVGEGDGEGEAGDEDEEPEQAVA